MAAIDLRTLNNENGGACKKVGSVGTTAQQIILPRWCKTVTVCPKNQAIYFEYDGTDGAAIGGDAFPHPVDVVIQYNPQKNSNDESSIFVAAQTGTSNVFLIME